MNVELFIARRYFRSKKKTGFISLITYITIFGISVGGFALVISLSVLNGFQKEVIERIIGFDSHLKIVDMKEREYNIPANFMERLKEDPYIKAISPYVMKKAMISSEGGQHVVYVKGVEEKTVDLVSNISQNLYGELNLLREGKKLPGIMIGFNLADKLGVTLGDTVTVVNPLENIPFFQLPPVKNFMVTGIFRSDLFNYDDIYTFISLSAAREFFNLGSGITGIAVKTDNFNDFQRLKEQISALLPPGIKVVSWYDEHRDLFVAMRMEKWAAFIILSLIIVVAAFNIISALIMVVLEKVKEIGILKAMGLSSRSIKRIFLYDGLIAGLIGTALGVSLGFFVSIFQQRFEFFKLPTDIYFLSSVPIVMKLTDFLLIISISLLLCIVFSLYPAKKASGLFPVEAIRYE
ncbi:MAG: ABC transporter permease [Fidelibacterota bacterium]